MPRYLVAKILEEERPANRVELEVLFMRHCVGTILEEHVLEFFKDNELQRFIVLALYRANVIIKEKDRGCVIQQLTMATGAHRKTVEKWVKQQYHATD